MLSLPELYPEDITRLPPGRVWQDDPVRVRRRGQQSQGACYTFHDSGVGGLNGQLGAFWPTYDVEPTEATFKITHWCQKALVLNYTRPDGVVEITQAYDVFDTITGIFGDGGVIGSEGDTTSAFWVFDPIDWYFEPSPEAMDEILTMARDAAVADGLSDFFNPPTTGLMEVTLYLEMHRAWRKRGVGDPNNPFRIVLGGEESSYPVVLRICYNLPPPVLEELP